MRVMEMELEPIYLSEEANFSIRGSEYLVSTPTFGVSRILDVRTFQPSIPFGREYFFSYLLARTDKGIMLFEQVFLNLKPRSWKLVAFWNLSDLEMLSEINIKEIFFLIYDDLQRMAEERPWEKRGTGK